MISEYCKNCKYWEGGHGYESFEFGYCYRYPPVLFVKHAMSNLHAPNGPAELSEYFVNPLTSEVDWCGEFKPIKNKKTVCAKQPDHG
jgi:hypothetical protein